MGERFCGRGHGKLILAGEHAVVYGHPALAIAVDRGVVVTIEAIEGPTAAAPDTPCDARLTQALRLTLGESGWRVYLQSDLPLGRGMGSSAAIAVGLVRARAASRGSALTYTDIDQQAFAVERIFHGTPSGIDHAVSSRGGLVRYQKGPPLLLTPLPCPDLCLVVLDCGTPGDTKAMVAGVRERRAELTPILDAIGSLVPRVEAALADPETLGALFCENHQLLKKLGVSTPQLDRMVALCMRHGAWGAKLAGAGGGGVVFALCADPGPVLMAAARNGISAFTCAPAPSTEPL